MADYQRPEGWRFAFRGVSLRGAPDALPPDKFACAQNVRAPLDGSIQTRPGYIPINAGGGLGGGGGGIITDIRAYAALGTDYAPVFLVRNTTNQIILSSDAAVKATMGGAAGFGVRMVSFRPPANAQNWMYVASQEDYKKLSAPGAANAVTAQKAGIAEPFPSNYPTPVVAAAPSAPAVQDFTGSSGGWTASGTASGVSAGNLFTDTSGSVLSDPVVSGRKSVQVGLPGLYLKGMELLFAGVTQVQVHEVLPACPAATISAIQYYSGTSGACQIAFTSDISGSLQRGSIIRINATENILVLGVKAGSGGSAGTCFVETSTAGSFTSGSITGVPAIVVYGSVSASQTITSPTIHTSVAVGTGTLSQTLGSNPLQAFFSEDYVHITLLLNNIAAVTTVSVILNTGNSGGSPDFKTSILQFTVTGATLAQSIVAGELFELTFAISQMSGFSGVMPQNVNGVQVSVTATGTTTLDVGSLWVGGGGNLDVGASGIPYQYIAVPRSSLTGATGNGTADMRYGVNPRRQNVLLSLPSASYDSQIDTWDIYRFGGTVTSYRYVGSAGAGASFTDNATDAQALGGPALVTDNFEPWPSVANPVTSSQTTSVGVKGSWVTFTSSAFSAALFNRLMPGTIVLVGGNAFTMRGRPFGSNPFIFETEECIGFSASTTLAIPEPLVANQPLPYLWGPDAQGTLFSAGDYLRPGTVQFAKANQPDMVSDQNVMELSPPSEEMLGGEIMNGLSYAASSLRWWALYPSLPGSQTETSAGSVVTITTASSPYNPLEIPVGKPLAAPFGHLSDGLRIYFWSKDGIYFHSGGPAESLTDEDLYPIFPHEGVQASNIVRNGVTFYAPDYSRSNTFRLGKSGNYLFADYEDSGGNPRNLVCDLRTKAWSQDSFPSNLMTFHYGVEAPEEALVTGPTLYPLLILGGKDGYLFQEKDLSNDVFVQGNAGTGISCVLGTFEWDGGDRRALGQFGDLYLDSVPVSGLTAQPVSLGSAVGSATSVGAASSRTFSPVSLAGGALKKYLGLQLSWTDNFSTQTSPTVLHLWQASVLLKPETSTDRFGDWDSAGSPGNKLWQGFILKADTFNVAKSVQIRDADTQTLHTFQPSTVTHNGEEEIAYSFGTPFYAHMVRDEPQDSVPWRRFGFKWVTQPAPENVQTWKTAFSSFGLGGWLHIPWIDIAYTATQTVTLAIIALNGTNPSNISLPATGGGVTYAKLRVYLSPNKGQAFQFSATSGGNFQIFQGDWQVWIGKWGRPDSYQPIKLMGGIFGAKAEI